MNVWKLLPRLETQESTLNIAQANMQITENMPTVLKKDTRTEVRSKIVPRIVVVPPYVTPT